MSGAAAPVFYKADAVSMRLDTCQQQQQEFRLGAVFLKLLQLEWQQHCKLFLLSRASGSRASSPPFYILLALLLLLELRGCSPPGSEVAVIEDF
jgi:hypothetical protein